jgi:glycosyltransferase involved in cell wall biosynthesis
MLQTVIVVPCYNEARRLDLRSFEQFAERTAGVDFLFVNDGSADNTLELLERLHAKNPRRFRFLHLKQNAGKAEAVRQGCLLAFASRPKLIGFWDADLATPLEAINQFVDVLNRQEAIDTVIGSRLPLLGHRIERRPLRRLLGRAFANVARLAIQLPVYDTQCGAKLFRADLVFQQALSQPFCSRWIFDVELFARLQLIRRQQQLPSLIDALYELPLDEWRDVAGSKIKSGDFGQAAWELAQIYWRYGRSGAQFGPAAPPAPQPGRKRKAA